MTQPSPLIGIDIGSTAVRICQLDRLDSDYQLVLYDKIDLSQSPVGRKRKSLRVRDAINELIERNELHSARAVISPPSGDEFLHRLKLRPYRGGFRRSEAAAELYVDLPAIPEAMYIQALPCPGGAPDDSLVFAAQRDAVNRQIEMLKQLHVDVPIVDGSLFALYNLWVKFYREESTLRVAIVDIGDRLTRFVVIENERWLGHGVCDVGGRNLSLRLQNVLDLDREEAEAYKVGGSDAGDGGIIPRDVHEVLADGARELATAIASALRASVDSGIDRIFLTGRSSALSLVRHAMHEATNVEVSQLHPFSHILVPTEDFAPAFLERINPEAAVAAGLALRAEDAK